MSQYDVALWLTRYSLWPEYIGFVDALGPSLAVEQLMQAHGLTSVFRAAAGGDGTIRRWYGVTCSPVTEVNENV